MNLQQHILECAEESGVDYPPVNTNRRKLTYKGHTIKVWYNENSASVFAWNAFTFGIGTAIGASNEEAIQKIKNKIDLL